ncbi:hypothetical protein BpHYR1_035836 [Brachionus plicatilis]|uniref:Uncharacterized protein n=1 Tax=Brachionus plicatilis TaxID=10195 RepID=A0A3M7QBM7_BRAPC|nr:hypothetical protein BpHYR1_035836 [Brachionus plicatilis]
MCLTNYMKIDGKCEVNECDENKKCRQDLDLECHQSRCICSGDRIFGNEKCVDAGVFIIKAKFMKDLNVKIDLITNMSPRRIVEFEFIVNKMNERLVYKIPLDLGSVNINVLINNQLVDINENFDTNDGKEFCFDLSKKVPPKKDSDVELKKCLSLGL